jgi:16S rRNA (cytosine1407-C5)-methyltransferase
VSKRKRPAANPQPLVSTLDAALARFGPLLSAADFTALMQELERPLYPALRANPLKCDPQSALQAWAARYAWQAQPVPFCPTGIQVLASPAPISQTPEHRLGFYYIQDAASMLPVELFDFNGLDSPLILDLAASPGGKTTHLISRSGDRGLVIANDSSQERLAALRIVLQNWGGVTGAVTHFPGEKFGAWFPGTFDRVLLDAPCSMQGLRAAEGRPMRSITEREQASLAQRQAALLESALRAVKVGGQVVYSTCTLSPEEDEGVLDTLLKQYPGAFVIDDLNPRLGRPVPGLSADGERSFDPAVKQAARIWPQIFGTAGFFAARLTKCAPLPVAAQEAPSRSLARAGFEPLERRLAAALLAQLLDLYGWDGAAFLEGSSLELWQRGPVVYMLPQSYLGQFAYFPVQSLGLVLGEDAPEGFTPSHEWAARFGLVLPSGICRLPAGQVAAWLRGEDIQGRPDSSLPSGCIAIVQDEEGRLLGRGKILSGRLKNLLPRRVLTF